MGCGYGLNAGYLPYMVTHLPHMVIQLLQVLSAAFKNGNHNAVALRRGMPPIHVYTAEVFAKLHITVERWL